MSPKWAVWVLNITKFLVDNHGSALVLKLNISMFKQISLVSYDLIVFIVL